MGCPTHYPTDGFNPLAGIRCFLTCGAWETDEEYLQRFNPLAGIRCFLTLRVGEIDIDIDYECFNPLAGIRCFLTVCYLSIDAVVLAFQSPSGDSLFSDRRALGASRTPDPHVSIP